MPHPWWLNMSGFGSSIYCQVAVVIFHGVLIGANLTLRAKMLPSVVPSPVKTWLCQIDAVARFDVASLAAAVKFDAQRKAGIVIS